MYGKFGKDEFFLFIFNSSILLDMPMKDMLAFEAKGVFGFVAQRWSI